MPLAQAKFVPYEMKTSIIRIFAYENGNHVGVIKNSHFGGEVRFDSTIGLLKIIDELQDAISFPQKSMLTRSFAASAEEREPSQAMESDTSDIRELASFRLNILFRQNASWQGALTWIETDTLAEFRSALEFLFLMDSVLSGAAAANPPRSRSKRVETL
ncbi:MAG: hypothetical protein LBH17_04145 [Oscillospiraceae bacterium]|jgi:hypothetical protein|nr:hypothetical protein [Oscillospiraceae bacterium]